MQGGWVALTLSRVQSADNPVVYLAIFAMQKQVGQFQESDILGSDQDHVSQPYQPNKHIYV